MSQEQVTTAPNQEPIGAMVDRLVQFDGPPESFLQELLATQCQLAEADSGAMLRGKAGEPPSLIAAHPALNPATPAPLWLSQAVNLIRQRSAISEPLVSPVQQSNELYGQPAAEHVILLPLLAGSGVRGFVVFLVENSDPVQIEQCKQRLELSLSLLSLYEMRLTLQRREAELQGVATAIEVLSSSNEQGRFRSFAMAICNEIAARWKAERVSLGILTGSYIKLRAMSHTEHIVRKMKLVQDIESAMEECLDQDLEVSFPPPPEAGFVYRAASELHNQHGPSAICSLPLRREGEVTGVLTIERATDAPLELEQVEFLRLAGDLIAPRLVELHDRDRWFGARLAASSRKGFAAILGPRHTWAKLTAIALLILVLVLILVPGKYRVEASFIFETLQRQVVPAPFDGYVESVAVEPGDPVDADQTVLATLETAELRLQRENLAAERAGYLKQATLALREEKEVEVQIAEAQAAQAQAQILLLDHQIRQAAIQSPITGRVIEGELKKRIGAPVSRGDVMFEVAPLDALRAVLHVEDDDIANIHIGQQGELATQSHPGEHVPFEVELINPMAEILNNRNVFRVRVKLLETRPWMRPGSTGLAKATVGNRSYAWIWTKDAVNWIRMKIWI